MSSHVTGKIEQELRNRVVTEARTWLGTPFHLMGRVKGPRGGVDCFTLLACVFHALGLTPAWEAEFYRGDFWCHDKQNSYLRTILKYVKQVPLGMFDTRPGNIVLARRRVGPDMQKPEDWHGGIITSWPMVVHAFQPRVSEDNCTSHPAYQVSGGLGFFNPFEEQR